MINKMPSKKRNTGAKRINKINTMTPTSDHLKISSLLFLILMTENYINLPKSSTLIGGKKN
jgi:hypothetical protein